MLRILLVDDDPDLRFLTEMTLTESGHEVITAPCGKEAIDLARNSRFDLILLDVLMPEMDGFEVNRKLKADPFCSGIPVIFLTAQIPEDKDVDFILKPYDPETIGSLIGELLEKTKR